MKKIILFLSIFIFYLFSAQSDHRLYAKGNVLFAPIGMINLGLEYQLSPKYTIQGDVFASPWKSFAGIHAQVYMGHIEGRYYFQEAFKHWYLGINAGTSVFDIQKWNYVGETKYQRGFNFMFGATVGYQLQWKEKWNIDLFLGGGSSSGYYHGYEYDPPKLFRYESAKKWNKSGEIIPYRGGIMIAYKLN